LHLGQFLRFTSRRVLLSAVDAIVTNPVIRWTWTGPGNEEIMGTLPEFRPTDRETVLEMMQGRYLLSSRLIDTQGDSPFSIEAHHADWVDELNSFAWLRHFRDARTEEERRFARVLTLDWIDRGGRFNRTNWQLSLTARRILNWLRHYSILMEGADPGEAQRINRSLATQISSLKLRGPLALEPVDALLVAIALLGVAVCADRPESEVLGRIRAVQRLLDQQIDDDGLHRSRSARTQVKLLVELTTVRQVLLRHYESFAVELTELTELMQRALDAISLGTGEPGYFNGTGQMAHDILVAVQAQSASRARASCVVGGYGRLITGRSIVVADSGLVPEAEFAGLAHAGALAFEFSHGRDLVVCNCGPAPTGYDDPLLFRQGIAHSAPTINALSSAHLVAHGPMAGRLTQMGAANTVEARTDEDMLVLRAHGYTDKFHVVLQRSLTLLAEGKTLVGQDRFLPQRNRISGSAAIRFHLAHQTEVQVGDEIVRMRLASGAIWTFLWEGASMHIEDSVRHSAYFGLHRTRQIVLEAPVAAAGEISWIFTLEEA
jgi:uncharacterized heparinase superfamily protein